jgi:hypothetical protein
MSSPIPTAKVQLALIEFLPIAHPMAKQFFDKPSAGDLMLCAQTVVLSAMGAHLAVGLTDEDPVGIQ